MKNVPLLIGTILGSILLIFGVAFFFSGDTSTPGSTDSAFDQTELMGTRSNVKGAANAQISIVEFSDFQCPACRASQPLIDEVMNTYPDQVELIYRHFPLDSIHPNARTAALASEVAATEGKFWEYHDLLFERQADWESIADRSKLKERFADYAAELEIDKASFLEKIEDTSIAEKVQADVTVANKAKVNATPTFYVNGRKVLGTDLLPQIESILATMPESNQVATGAADVSGDN